MECVIRINSERAPGMKIFTVKGLNVVLAIKLCLYEFIGEVLSYEDFYSTTVCHKNA